MARNGDLEEFFILLPHWRHKGLLSSQARAPSLRWGSRRARVPLRGKVTAMATGPNFLTVAEVAAQMRVSKMTVYRLVHAGDLEAVRVGRSFRVPEKAVEEYLGRSYFQAG